MTRNVAHLLLSAAVCVPAASHAASGRNGNPFEIAAIEQVVTYARRRAEAAEDAPVSLTSIDETQLREAGIVRFDQIQQLVPNLVFTRSVTGVDADIKIRGVGTSAIDGIFDPGVGVYLDGVLLGRTSAQLFDILDIEQIEVLRGPQGTLFGRNTIGGAINVTTIKPSDELEAFALLRPSNFDGLVSRFSVNAPVVDDRVLARFAFGTRSDSGYSTNTLTGLNYNDPTAISFLGSLRFLVTDGITIDVSGTWGRDRSRSRGSQCANVQETALGGLVPGYYEACSESKPFAFELDAPGLTSLSNSGVWGVGTWELGNAGFFEDVSLKATGAWLRQDLDVSFDVDSTRFPVLTFAAADDLPNSGEPFITTQTQGELQANASALQGRLQFVAGAFALWEDQDATTTLSVLPDVLRTISQQRQQYDNWTWALYGQGTAALTDWLSLTGGLRYTEEKKEATATTTDLGGPPMPPLQATNSVVFTAWTPMASLAATVPSHLLDEVEPLDHLMAYFSYARGFKGGGLNLVVGAGTELLEPFAPETLDSFEIGFKARAFENRATFNASFYLGNYDDVQVTTFRVIDPDDPGSFERLTLNAAAATIKGFELETTINPIGGLLLSGFAGYTDATYDQFDGPSALDDSLVDRSGQTLNGIPKLQAHLAAQYSLPVDLDGPGWLQGWLTPRVEWYYQSAAHWDFPELMQSEQRGYGLLHARLSYAFYDSRAQVALWGRNLTSEEYFDATLSLANSAGTLTRLYGPPRFWGGELSYRF